MKVSAQRLFQTFVHMLPYELDQKQLEIFSLLCEAIELEIEQGHLQEQRRNRKGTIHDATIQKVLELDLDSESIPQPLFEDADTSPICRHCGKPCERLGVCEDCGIG